MNGNAPNVGGKPFQLEWEFNMDLIDKVRLEIRKDERSYLDLQKETGIDKGKLCKFANGKQNLSIDNFVKLLELYNLVK